MSKACAVCGKPLESGLVVHPECVPKWISVKDRLPDEFVSVLGHMTDAYPYPSVRECYRVPENKFYFPALQEVHPISHWMPMAEPPKEGNNETR